MPIQEAVTLRAFLRPNAAESLDRVLQQVGSDVENNPVLPFGTLENVHFARLVIVPEARDLNGRAIRASLVYAANVDGSGSAHLRELIKQSAVGIDRIFAHCE